VADHMEGPLALRALQTVKAELAGVLADLHLPERRLDDRLPSRVIRTALLRAEALAPRRALSVRSGRLGPRQHL
jgi:hypothetical protein